MPTYEYICMDCREKTEVFATISEKEKGLKLTCPKCSGKKLVQFFGRVNVGASRSLGGPPISGCGPMAGPGCCG
ncbi:MAG: Zinc ribbon domain protein [Syntrophus sp. PtaB.Bin138]|nr:MAG: Zinc ribbon domain protein [Syntrophus sp. PtaB.Bin138]